MTTSIQRRQFLRSLALLVIAPVVVARALVSKGSPVTSADMLAASVEPIKRDYLVLGVGIKVPSNRYTVTKRVRFPSGEERVTVEHTYYGDWDGMFHLERGCSNPAYILAHLVESDFKTTFGDSTDWVLSNDWGDLNWRAIYDWGVWADELVMDCETASLNLPKDGWWSTAHAVTWAPRYQINTIIQTEAQRAALKEELRMRFLNWRASDPRYRKSFAIKTRQCGTKPWGMS